MESIISKIGDNAEAIIALAALFLAVWQGFLQRKHNRASVRPYIHFNRTVQSTKPQIEIAICNSGLGPAVITKMTVHVDDQKVENWHRRMWDDIISNIGIPVVWGGGSAIRGTVLSSSQELSIMQYYTTNDDIHLDLDVYEIQKKLDRVKIEIEYESIYKDKFRETNFFELT